MCQKRWWLECSRIRAHRRSYLARHRRRRDHGWHRFEHAVHHRRHRNHSRRRPRLSAVDNAPCCVVAQHVASAPVAWVGEQNMKLRSFVLIGLSLVLGLITVMLSRNHESSAAPMAKVIAAKTLLSYGDRITPANLQLMDYPLQSVPEGAFSTIEDIAGPG